MTTTILVLLALAVFHFVYESILAPSLRLSLRFRLFALRDEARQLKIECVDSLNDAHCVFLQASINRDFKRISPAASAAVSPV